MVRRLFGWVVAFAVLLGVASPVTAGAGERKAGTSAVKDGEKKGGDKKGKKKGGKKGKKGKRKGGKKKPDQA
jgi:hypothetical protein